MKQSLAFAIFRRLYPLTRLPFQAAAPSAARFPSTVQINFDGAVLSTQQMGYVRGGVNSRSYNGPTEIVAQGEADDCPNGLAPHPLRRPAC